VKKYRKKPIVIEASKWSGRTDDPALQWLSTHKDAPHHMGWSPGDGNLFELVINTPEGAMTVEIGDWIIKGIEGEFYPCKPDIFQKTYDEVKEN